MKEKKLINCIVGETMRDIVEEARKLEIPRENIVQFLKLGNYIYLVYYK